jgi:hypothetical protein
MLHMAPRDGILCLRLTKPCGRRDQCGRRIVVRLHFIVLHEVHKIRPEEEGDGLPNMQWRLRVIAAAALGGIAVWAALIFLI